MKPTITSVLILLFYTGFGQEIFEYEKQISDIENYNCIEIQFNSEEIDYKKRKSTIALFGTLIEPKEKEFEKIVIIVPGSGMDSRHSHHLLTKTLLDNNIAVFRYDERGVNKSEGSNFNVRYGIRAITKDLLAAIKSIKFHYQDKELKYGLIGHSQGGLSTINAITEQEKIDFLIQWAVPIEKHGEFFKYQIKTGVNTFDNELMFDSKEKKIEIINIVQEVVRQNLDDDDSTLSKKLDKATKKYGYKRKNYDRFRFYTFPTRKEILRQNNEQTYKKLNIPMLYIVGSKDLFVDPEANTNLLKNFNNENIESIVLEGLNHYLTKEEIYPGEIEMSASLYNIDRIALDSMINWIKKK